MPSYKEPSLFWLGASLVGLGLDAFSVLKLFRLLKPAVKNFNTTGDLGKFAQQIENLKELGSDLKAKLREVAKIREQIRESVNLGRKKAEEMMQQLEELLGVNSPQPAMAGEYSSKHFPSQVPQKKPNVVEMSGKGVGGGSVNSIADKIGVDINNIQEIQNGVWFDKSGDINTIKPHELAFSEQKVCKHIKDDIILPKDDTYPAIDAIHKSTGKPMSYKSLQNSFKNFNKRINEAYHELQVNNVKANKNTIHKGKVLDEWTNVELHIDLEFDQIQLPNGKIKIIDADYVKFQWNKGIRVNGVKLKNDGIITDIIVYLKDGTSVPLDMTLLK